MIRSTFKSIDIKIPYIELHIDSYIFNLNLHLFFNSNFSYVVFEFSYLGDLSYWRVYLVFVICWLSWNFLDSLSLSVVFNFPKSIFSRYIFARFSAGILGFYFSLFEKRSWIPGVELGVEKGWSLILIYE